MLYLSLCLLLGVKIIVKLFDHLHKLCAIQHCVCYKVRVKSANLLYNKKQWGKSVKNIFFLMKWIPHLRIGYVQCRLLFWMCRKLSFLWLSQSRQGFLLSRGVDRMRTFSSVASFRCLLTGSGLIAHHNVMFSCFNQPQNWIGMFLRIKETNKICAFY